MILQFTSAYFTATNPILSLEAVGFETDTFRTKNGNGITPWNSLLYTGFLLINNHLEPETKSSFKELTFTGAIDGVNNVFVFNHVPLQVYYNGGLLKRGAADGYTLVGTTVTVVRVPFVDEIIEGFGNY